MRLSSIMIFLAVCVSVFSGCTTDKVTEKKITDVSIDSNVGTGDDTLNTNDRVTDDVSISSDDIGDVDDALANGVSIDSNEEAGGSATSGVSVDRSGGAVVNVADSAENLTAESAVEDSDDFINNNAGSVANADEPSLSDEPQIVGRGYRDAQGRLRAFSYGTERLSLSGGASGGALVNYSDGRAVRKRYDDAMRLAKIEVWRIGDSASESARESEQTFQYNDDETFPASSVAEGDGWRIETRYDEKGRMLVENVFFVINDNKIPDTETVRTYDADGRIIEENYTRFDYSDEQKSKRMGTFMRRDVYEYVAENPEPNHEHYEDDVLRVKTVWLDGDNYTTTMYFDGGYAIVSEYSHGRKTRETVMRQGIVQRARTYED